MFNLSQPDLTEFSDYGQYALAVVGYAILHGDHRIADHVLCSSAHKRCDTITSDPAISSHAGNKVSIELGCSSVEHASATQGYVIGSLSSCSRSAFVDNCASTSSDVDAQSGERSAGGCGSGDGERDVGGESVVGKPSVRGKNWERNRDWKEQKKRRKQRKKDFMSRDWREARGDSVPEFRDPLLVKSSCAKWIAENDLAEEKARRQLAVLRANDVEQEIKRHGVRVSAAIERDMVSIEKTHNYLSKTGNVPLENGGLSGSEDSDSTPSLSISPHSSVSMAEVRAMQKENLDLHRIIDLYHNATKISPKAIGCLDKDEWTNNSENAEILGELYEHGYGRDFGDGDGSGKFRVVGV